MLGALLTLFVIGVLGFVAVMIVLSLIGVVVSLTVGLAGFLLFKVAPVILLGWVVVKLVGRSRARRRIAAADQRWLDS